MRKNLLILQNGESDIKRQWSHVIYINYIRLYSVCVNVVTIHFEIVAGKSGVIVCCSAI